MVSRGAFSKKKLSWKEICAIVARYQPETQSLNADDTAFMCDVFRHHQEWDMRTSSGVASITIRVYYGNTRSFVLHMNDGTQFDISWLYALMPNGGPSKSQHASAAARFEIEHQIKAFRNGLSRDTPCALCGSSAGDMHVDHMAPRTFAHVLGGWLAQVGKALNDIDTYEHSDTVRLYFKDRSLAALWQKFHEDRTSGHLRIIHASANVQLGQKPNAIPVCTESGH